jgi:BON domain-containing protein
MLKTVVCLSGALAIFGLTGCISTADRSAGRVLDDKLISSKVKKELDNAPVYKFTDVKVNTYRGVVQLSGFVDTDEQKQKAGEIAKQIGWVREVMNNISIKPKDEYYRGRAPGERETTVGTDRSYTTPATNPPPANTLPPERTTNP